MWIGFLVWTSPIRDDLALGVGLAHLLAARYLTFHFIL